MVACGGGKPSCKVFVANPSKPPPIAAILEKNRDKLLTYLSQFQNER